MVDGKREQTRDYHVKQNKPDTEKQNARVFSRMQNLYENRKIVKGEVGRRGTRGGGQKRLLEWM